MNESGLSAKRLTIGLCALFCLAAAAGLWLFSENPETNQLLSALTRVGLVLAAVWLAFPKRSLSLVWEKTAPILLGAAIVVAIMPRLIKYVLPAAVLLSIAALILRPRPKGPRVR